MPTAFRSAAAPRAQTAFAHTGGSLHFLPFQRQKRCASCTQQMSATQNATHSCPLAAKSRAVNPLQATLAVPRTKSKLAAGPSRLCKCGQRALCLCAAVAQGIDAVHRLPVAVLLCILLILPHRHLKPDGQAAYSWDEFMQLWQTHGKSKKQGQDAPLQGRLPQPPTNSNLPAAHLLHGLRAWPLLAICPHVAIWPQLGRHQHLCGGITQDSSTIHTRTTAASQPCPLGSSRWPTAWHAPSGSSRWRHPSS